MICPRCETPTLVSHQRGGMEIDVCSTCGGVWLDRGELERLALTPPAPSSAAMVDDVELEKRHDDDDRQRSKSESKKKDKDKDDKKKKQKTLGARVADALDDVFDDVLDIFD